ncbi:hypothetical protein B5F10_09530 [Anaerotruncus colihominis]|uniref:Uncharacterized protein n=1 Tax=Anaerotruncus colihominis TaxID=169435 RepID=A0A1Y4MZ36_9FIRM|nr:hypothetical protein B5F11_10740 [Anaerotruncus colihominis]OUP73934.1 hypothetical protein B5F10_09530 [Anaerotruncus colihominis]
MRATPSFVCRGPAKCAPAAPRLSRILLPDSASSEQDSCGLYTCSARPIIRGAACINAEPNPLFAAQPTKVFRRGLFSKRPESFLAYLFFKKGKFQKSGRGCRGCRRREG